MTKQTPKSDVMVLGARTCQKLGFSVAPEKRYNSGLFRFGACVLLPPRVRVGFCVSCWLLACSCSCRRVGRVGVLGVLACWRVGRVGVLGVLSVLSVLGTILSRICFHGLSMILDTNFNEPRHWQPLQTGDRQRPGQTLVSPFLSR